MQLCYETYSLYLENVENLPVSPESIPLTFLQQSCLNYLRYRACGRAVDLGGASVYRGGQSLILSTKAAVIKRVRLLIGRTKNVDWGSKGPGPTLAPALLRYFKFKTFLLKFEAIYCYYTTRDGSGGKWGMLRSACVFPHQPFSTMF